jgi:Ca2+-binding RTX toxin-like protein
MIQMLERRRLLASAIVNAGVLEVTGDPTDDNIDVSVDVPGNHVIITINANPPINLTLSDITVGFLVNAGSGNDTVTFGANTANATVNGQGGHDSIVGTPGNDTLNGNAGHDTLVGSFGNDVMSGGAGSDDLDGGAGHDTTSFAEFSIPLDLSIDDAFNDTPENDNIRSSVETVLGGSGNDGISAAGMLNAAVLVGNGGHDSLVGGAANDTLDGSEGHDTLVGNEGHDSLTGFAGEDSLDGGAGFDTLLGGDEDDTLVGGADADEIFAGGGDDLVDGGAGLDDVTLNPAGLGEASMRLLNSQDLRLLSINNGGSARLSDGGPFVLYCQTLTVSGTGTLDLLDHDLIIDYTGGSVLGDIRALLRTGYLGGGWNGSGINSSAAAADAQHRTALGYAEASDILSGSGGSFAGVTVDASAVLIKFTYNGDANLNGSVAVDDLGRLASNWQASPRDWAQGNFDYDAPGLVNVNDLGLLASNWQAGVASPLAPRPLPRVFDELSLCMRVRSPLMPVG